jgi:hypothetical protein
LAYWSVLSFFCPFFFVFDCEKIRKPEKGAKSFLQKGKSVSTVASGVLLLHVNSMMTPCGSVISFSASSALPQAKKAKAMK